MRLFNFNLQIVMTWLPRWPFSHMLFTEKHFPLKELLLLHLSMILITWMNEFILMFKNSWRLWNVIEINMCFNYQVHYNKTEYYNPWMDWFLNYEATDDFRNFSDKRCLVWYEMTQVEIVDINYSSYYVST